MNIIQSTFAHWLYVIYMLVFATAIYTFVPAVIYSFRDVALGWVLVTPFSCPTSSHISSVSGFVVFISFMRILPAIFAKLFQMIDPIPFTIIRVIVWLFLYIFSGVFIIAFFTIAIYATRSRFIFVKLRQRENSITSWAKFCIHNSIIPFLCNKYNTIETIRKALEA